MTNHELLRLLERRAAQLEPDVARAILRSFERVRELLGEAELARLLSEASVDRLLTESLDAQALEEAFAGVRKALHETLERATTLAARQIPGPAIQFHVLNPRILDAIRELDSQVMQVLTETTRTAVRESVTIGLEEGVGPRVIARRIRSDVGLAPNQIRAVANFRRELETGSFAALRRQLRDRRFDGTLRKAFTGAGLSRAQIDKMVTAYERRFRAFHAETIARTASLEAMKQGQRLSWEDAIRRGIVDGRRLWKRWITVQDDRVRPTHREMHGETVPFRESYSTGQMVAGEHEFSCRCVDRVFLRAA